MDSRTRPGRRLGAGLAAAVVGFASMAVLTVSPAGADPVSSGSASAFGGEVALQGEPVIVGGEAAVEAPPGDVTDTVVDIPAEPVAVSGTFTAIANAHVASDIESGLTVNEQTVAGPYNTRGLGQVEGAQVLLDVVGEGIPLVSAAAVRGEAVAVCTAGVVSYSANSEIIDLDIAGTDVPLNAPLQDLIDTLNGVLVDTGLSEVVNIERNVVTETEGGGIAVDALVVTVLAAAGDVPLATVRLGHAEVGPTSCDIPECSDTVDNDGDGTADIDDPACHTDGDADNPDSFDPLDDSETKECSDTVDNDGDAVADSADPGCHSDNDATNDASFEPFDNDETDRAQGVLNQGTLPRTGGTPTGAFAGAGLLAAALGAVAIRRRVTA